MSLKKIKILLDKAPVIEATHAESKRVPPRIAYQIDFLAEGIHRHTRLPTTVVPDVDVAGIWAHAEPSCLLVTTHSFSWLMHELSAFTSTEQRAMIKRTFVLRSHRTDRGALAANGFAGWIDSMDYTLWLAAMKKGDRARVCSVHGRHHLAAHIDATVTMKRGEYGALSSTKYSDISDFLGLYLAAYVKHYLQQKPKVTRAGSALLMRRGDLASAEVQSLEKPNMTKAEKAALAQARAAQAERKALPDSERVPITNPDKYGFPIGIDDQGNLFPTASKSQLLLEDGVEDTSSLESK